MEYDRGQAFEGKKIIGLRRIGTDTLPMLLRSEHADYSLKGTCHILRLQIHFQSLLVEVFRQTCTKVNHSLPLLTGTIETTQRTSLLHQIHLNSPVVHQRTTTDRLTLTLGFPTKRTTTQGPSTLSQHPPIKTPSTANDHP